MGLRTKLNTAPLASLGSLSKEQASSGGSSAYAL